MIQAATISKKPSATGPRLPRTERRGVLTPALPRSAPASLPIAEARRDVVVHDADGLQVRVADRRAHEAEAALLEILAERVGQRGARRDLLERGPRVVHGFAVDETPQVAVERAEFLLHREERARVRDRRVDLEPVADDAGIREQLPRTRRVEARDLLGIESGEHLAVVLALVQHGLPAESGLRALEHEHLEQMPVLVLGHAPLAIVVLEVQ